MQTQNRNRHTDLGHYWELREGTLVCAPIPADGSEPADDEWYLPEPELLDQVTAERTRAAMARAKELLT